MRRSGFYIKVFALAFFALLEVGLDWAFSAWLSFGLRAWLYPVQLFATCWFVVALYDLISDESIGDI